MTTASDTIAEKIRTRRRQIGLTRQQLADRCATQGHPALTFAAITNIETGRPGKDGQRRRHVTVEELLALTDALEDDPQTATDGDAPGMALYALLAADHDTARRHHGGLTMPIPQHLSKGERLTGDGPDDLMTTAEARHIARHDPARVLRQVAAGRELLRLHADALDMITLLQGHDRDAVGHTIAAEAYAAAIRTLASAYADHPDYLKALASAG